MFSKSEIRIIGLILLCFLIGYTSQKISEHQVRQFDPTKARANTNNNSNELGSLDTGIAQGALEDEESIIESKELDSMQIDESSKKEIDSDNILVNINTAGEKELTRVKGIGPKTAQKIMDYRDKNGPFKSISGLTSVKGIGPKKLEKMKPYLKL